MQLQQFTEPSDDPRAGDEPTAPPTPLAPRDIPVTPIGGPVFEEPTDDDDALDARIPEVLEAEVVGVAIPTVVPAANAWLAAIRPHVDVLRQTLVLLGALVRSTPNTTPEGVVILGELALRYKTAEHRITALYEPGITPLRGELAPIYAERKPLLDTVTADGTLAARRHLEGQRRLDAARAKADAEALRATVVANAKAEADAAAVRTSLAAAAQLAVASGDTAKAVALTTQARLMTAQIIEAPPAPDKPVTAVKGVSGRKNWCAAVEDFEAFADSVLRPRIYRELALALERGDFIPGTNSFTVQVLVDQLKTRASEAPLIPIACLQVDEQRLKKMAEAQEGTVVWPGIKFHNDETPTRRAGR